MLRLQWGNSGTKSRLTASEINPPQRGENPLTKANAQANPLRCPTNYGSQDMAPPLVLKREVAPARRWGRAWPGPKLAERIKRRLPLALHVGEMWEETHFHSHIVGPISLSRSDPPFRDLFVAPEICSFDTPVVNETSIPRLKPWSK